MYDKVFISYAKEDHETAEKLFDFLTLYRYDPWLDKKKIITGARLEYRNKISIKKSRLHCPSVIKDISS